MNTNIICRNNTTAVSPTALLIDSITIRQDSDGRFCLNDLHKAAGGADKDEPNRFFRLDTTAELLLELSNSPEMGNKVPVDSKKGRYGGTYVVKELVYAYAMWISPAFHLKVIRAYDRLATQGVAATPRHTQSPNDHCRISDEPLHWIHLLIPPINRVSPDKKP